MPRVARSSRVPVANEQTSERAPLHPALPATVCRSRVQNGTPVDVYDSTNWSDLRDLGRGVRGGFDYFSSKQMLVWDKTPR